MSNFDGIPQTKVSVEMPPVKEPVVSQLYGAYTPPSCEFPPFLTVPTPPKSPSDRILEKAEIAEAVSELFVKHNKAINMDHHDSKPKGFWYHWYNFTYWLSDNNPFNRYRTITSIEEFDKLPFRKKHTFLFWYNDPMLRGDGWSATTILGRKVDREALEKYMKRKYFIQYPLRQWCWKTQIRLSRYWDEVCYFLNPRQKWIKKQIPNSWCDKTHLIPLVNFSIVVDFVENEDALNVTDWEASSEQASQFEKELKDCYDYVKTRRPKLEEDHGNSYPDEETTTGDYDTDYAETNRLEIELNKNDTKYLTWIVVNRDFFWT